MTRNLIVTTPKSQMELAAKEAADCLRMKGGFYFRTFRIKPQDLAVRRYSGLRKTRKDEG